VAGLRAQLEEANSRLVALDAQLSDAGAAAAAAAAQHDQLSAESARLGCVRLSCCCSLSELNALQAVSCSCSARNKHLVMLNNECCRAELHEAQQREQATAQQAAELGAEIEALQVRSAFDQLHSAGPRPCLLHETNPSPCMAITLAITLI
jgi:hypothetical protein